MATTFPDQIQEFDEKMNIDPTTDIVYLKAYQEAVLAQDIVAMREALSQIPLIGKKLITSEDFNVLTDTCYALQQFYLARYSSAYIVSETQPITQAKGDFWIKIDK